MRAILVPVKSFRDAKHRLVGALDDLGRRRLASTLAATVLRQCGSAPAFIACDDDEVANWALDEGATVLWTPGLGLSGAVRAGVSYLGSLGFDLAVVAHADLPFAHDLDRFGSDGEITLAPDHRLDGTNVAALPTSADFHFSYGPRSYRRHQLQARRSGLACRSVFDWRLASDIDLPSDLELISDLPEYATLLENARAVAR